MDRTVIKRGLINMMVVAVASGVVLMPALNRPVVVISSTERSDCRPRCAADGKFRHPLAADDEHRNGGEEEPRPGDLHQGVIIHQVFHHRVEGDEAEDGGKHPENAGNAVFMGGNFHGLEGHGDGGLAGRFRQFGMEAIGDGNAVDQALVAALPFRPARCIGAGLPGETIKVGLQAKAEGLEGHEQSRIDGQNEMAKLAVAPLVIRLLGCEPHAGQHR